MELRLERCTIRDYRASDAESLARHANNRKIWLGLRDAFPHPYTIEDANNFLRGSIAGLTRIHFCIEIGGEAVGGIGIRPGEDVHRHRGVWLLARRRILGAQHHERSRSRFRGLLLQRIFAESTFCHAAFKQSRFSPSSRKSRIRFRGVLAQERGESRPNSRFASLREENVSSRVRCIIW